MNEIANKKLFTQIMSFNAQDFYPNSFILPEDYEKLKKLFKNQKATFIGKPDTGS